MKILSEEQIILHPTDSFNPQKHGPYIGCLVDQKLDSFEIKEKEMIAKMAEQGIVAIQTVYCGPKCPPVKLANPLIDNTVRTNPDNRGSVQVASPVTKDPLNPLATNQQGSSKSNDRSQVFASQTDNFNAANRNVDAQDGGDGKPRAQVVVSAKETYFKYDINYCTTKTYLSLYSN